MASATRLNLRSMIAVVVLGCLIPGCTTIGANGRVCGKTLFPACLQRGCLNDCGCWCPDDYCRKPLPGDPCGTAECCCDDYCGKPSPAVPCPTPTVCCDDYCSKPWCPPPCRPIPGATCPPGTATPSLR